MIEARESHAHGLLGAVLIVGSALLFAMTSVLGRMALDRGMTVESMLAARFSVAAVLLLTLAAVVGRPLVAARGERIAIVVLANMGYALESNMFFLASRHATLATVGLLFYGYPAIVTLASWALLHRPPTLLAVVAVCASVTGAGIVVAGGGHLAAEPVAIVLALGSAVAYATYLMGTDRRVRRTDPFTGAAWVTGSAALGMSIVASVSQAWMVPTARQWGPLLGMSLATGAAFVCLLSGLPRLGAVWTSILSTSEAVAIPVFAWLLLSEAVERSILLGGILVLAGAAVASVAIRTPMPPEL